MTVTLPYDPDWRALEWAMKNCPSYITNKAKTPVGCSPTYYIVYHFGDEKDAVMFMLRWK